jgi:cellulose synthase/poly-beta-1,6-N-acetylglucosamine synthase-like glycosyltransferase
MLSFIITAFNEEAQIEKKLENTLLAEYPKEKLEIIVASDGSTDETNTIVESYANRGVILHPVAERKGKENAQRSAIQSARGDILVFSDVSTKIETSALKQIALSFENKKVGAVSSEDRFLTESGEVAGEGAYVKYEMWLRKLEGKVSGLVGLSGSFFAARKDVCKDWNISVPSDFNTALNCIKNNYIAITEPKLLGFYPNLKDETKEYQRKVRTVIRGIAALFSQPSVMNPFKYGLFAFQVISHKLMRWLVPWFLLLCFVTNLLLLSHSFCYQLIFLMQIGFYSLAFSGWLSSTARQNTLVKIPYFFVQVNIAIAHATVLYLTGKRVTLWSPSKR